MWSLTLEYNDGLQIILTYVQCGVPMRDEKKTLVPADKTCLIQGDLVTLERYSARDINFCSDRVSEGM